MSCQSATRCLRDLAGKSGRGDVDQLLRRLPDVLLLGSDREKGNHRLAVWWLRLGIQIERIKPGHPEQNGRHERMHLTLKAEATKPAAPNLLQQQARLDAFLTRYNQERPHQALAMKVPAEVYTPSSRAYRGLSEVDYPLHDWTAP